MFLSFSLESLFPFFGAFCLETLEPIFTILYFFVPLFFDNPLLFVRYHEFFVNGLIIDELSGFKNLMQKLVTIAYHIEIQTQINWHAVWNRIIKDVLNFFWDFLFIFSFLPKASQAFAKSFELLCFWPMTIYLHFQSFENWMVILWHHLQVFRKLSPLFNLFHLKQIQFWRFKVWIFGQLLLIEPDLCFVSFKFSR